VHCSADDSAVFPGPEGRLCTVLQLVPGLPMQWLQGVARGIWAGLTGLGFVQLVQVECTFFNCICRQGELLKGAGRSSFN
jgi:hypothetical protein